ncbi:ribosomal protein L1 [Trichosporon asahii var. asahii CBS 8904]|uniref:Ribosomal protein L1 n=2 Tax=Trichosporon asahii var. asahii TaxID=189963 RepID=K1V435_TRIAC|nr:ribosomal protein L1 [Trichosporon asahii var. asahii CBS 2479]EJT52185.1 ribosomal protein L1 [Trichosporon asahii var. asahii CBS 2479]EKC98724.1 ribosomal protein L1 [Trichosporon asahii var. asahii CBS 8904]
MLSTPLRTVPRAHGPALARAFSASSSAGKKKDVLKVQFTPWPAKEKFKLKEAVRVLRALEIGAPTSRFDLELITKVPKQGHHLRGQVVLPLDPRKGVREEVLVVFAESDSLSERLAKEVPGVIVGQQELCEPILTGKLKPTRVFSTPGMLPTVTANLARFLGPKGIMPTVKRGTVGEGRKLVDLIGDSGSRIDWAANDLGIIRFGVAKMGWTNDAIEENIRAFVKTVEKATLGQGEIIDMTSRKKTNCEYARRQRAKRDAAEHG